MSNAELNWKLLMIQKMHADGFHSLAHAAEAVLLEMLEDELRAKRTA